MIYIFFYVSVYFQYWLRKVFLVTKDLLEETNEEEDYPFFTFGSMILAQLDNDWNGSDNYASQLIEEENNVRKNELLNYFNANTDSRFLLGLTCYDQLHKDWIDFARKLSNPNKNENT